MRTRSGQRFGKTGTPPVPVREEEVPADEAATSSDDEAPEEQNFSTSKKTAAEQRKEEHKAREAAASHKKELRKARTSRLSREPELAATSGDKTTDASGALESREPDDGHASSDSEGEGDYDFLPEDVLREVEDASALNPRQAYEKAVVSQHLREGAAAVPKRKAPAHSRHVAGIKVQVLSSVNPSNVSASARDFLKQRLYGSTVRRSETMLHPANAAAMIRR